jgi:hypothetical protein
MERWQLLVPMTAMNGVLLFGWSTAVICEVLRRTIQPGSCGRGPRNMRIVTPYTQTLADLTFVSLRLPCLLRTVDVVSEIAALLSCGAHVGSPQSARLAGNFTDVAK